MVFPHSVKERVTKIWIFQRFLKMHKMLLSKQTMLSLDAPASSLSLSQTSSDIRFGNRNPALLRTDIADCGLRNEYSVRLIITKLEQVVTH